VLAQSGDLDGAQAMLARADGYPRGVHPLYAPQVELNRARLAAAAGEPNRAAYAKLGISGRAQLGAVLREHGPLS
jgi:hypothetical protein